MELGIPCKIGVLSDTQVPDPAKQRKFLKVTSRIFSSCDYIFHAGDIIYPGLLKDLAKIAPVLAVYGNEDSGKLRVTLPRRLDFRAKKFHISLLHGNRPIIFEAQNILANRIRLFLGRPPDLKGFYRHILQSSPGSDCIIFGHSHLAFLEIYNKTLLLNPGAFCIAWEMYNLNPSVATLDIKSSGISASIFTLDIEGGSFRKSKTKFLGKPN